MAVQRGHEFMTASERTRARRSEYPTPKASDGCGNLIDAVRYPTPIAGDADRGSSSSEGRPNGLRSSLLPSPRVGSGGSAGGADLRRAIAGETPRGWSAPALWPTPRASEWKGTGPIGSKSHDYRVEKHYLDATVQERTGESGPLNPDWVEWLMGFPIGWTDLDVAEPIFLEGEPWPAEPDVPRMRRDVPRRSARLKQLGNAVVPKNAEVVGWRLRELLEEVEPE